MKRNIKILSFILSIIFCFSFIAGCGGNDEPVSGGNRLISRKEFTGGTHVLTAPERNDYFVLNGISEYKIIAPKASTLNANLEVALRDFNTFLKESTGTSLPIIYENDRSSTFKHDANQKYISIGNTKLLTSAGLKGDLDELNVHGYRIKTIDNNVYLYGYTDRAAANAIYGFLSIMVNYEIYAPDFYTLDDVDTLKMRDFDVVDVPDGNSQHPGFKAHLGNEIVNQTRFRIGGISMYNVGDYEHGEKEVPFHNVLQLVSLNNPDVKNEWISDSKDQLCYTAHGDDESLEQMVMHVATIIEKSLMRNDSYKANLDIPGYVSITCEDTRNVCSCDSCSAATARYGTAAGAHILFCNRVMEELEKWMQKPGNEAYRNDQLKLVMFAYAGYMECPAHYDEKLGKYVLNDGLEMHPRVGVYLTNTVNSHYSMYDERNDVHRETLAAWMDVSNALTLWTWDNNFSFEVSLWDTFSHYDDEGYSYLLAGKPDIIFFEVGGDYVRTGFGMLKMYLYKEKLWDSSQKVDDLIDKWFTASFGAATNKMKELFASERLFELSLYENLSALESTSVLVTATKKEYWSLPTIKEWVNILEEAHEINERVNKTLNPEMYEIIKNNIDREYIYPGYVTLRIFSQADDVEFYKRVTTHLKANDKFFSDNTALSDYADTYRNAQ